MTADASASPWLARIHAWRRRIPLTREGLLWFLIAVGLLLVGLIKGINLITLLASLLIVLVACNGWLARAQLRRVRAERDTAELAFAQTPFIATVRVDNISRRLAGGFEVRAAIGTAVHAWPVIELPAGASTVLQHEAVYPRRGSAASEELTIACGYPLGLCWLERPQPLGPPRIVLPQLGRLHRARLRRLLSRRSPTQGATRGLPCAAPTARSEFHGLRPYRPGDSPRHVHWRTSARRGDLMVREYEDWPNDDLTLVVEARSSTGADDPKLERTIRLAATICWEWCRQSGDRLVLAVAGATVSITDGNTGHALAVAALQRLAVEPGSPTIDGDLLVTELRRQRLSAGPILILSPTDSLLGLGLQQALRRRVATLAADSADAAAIFET